LRHMKRLNSTSSTELAASIYSLSLENRYQSL
jgi:hypothetical protein